MSRVFFILACFLAAGLAEPATQIACRDVQSQCEVSNVDITPCATKRECRLKRGMNASISFDFTPEFDASYLEHDVSYHVASLWNLEKDACKFTTCPVSAGNKNTFTYNQHIGMKIPKGAFAIKWQLWNKAQPEQRCCFITKISIR